MSKRRQRRSSAEEPARENPRDTAPGDLTLRPWLLAAMVALLVARPLVPSEGVAWLGDGQSFCMQWLLLALGTSLAAIKARGFPRRFGWIELLACFFALLHSAAAWHGAALGNPRPTMNMLWEGVAMVMSFLLARQLLRGAREARAVVAAMVALSVVLSVFGFYQVFVSLPADRLEYRQNPDELLRRAGQWFAKGTPERQAFESRLGSTEPLATFALTNSLAGYLAPWLIVGLGMLRNRKRWAAFIPTAACMIAVVGCLILTKSRSAYAAGLLGTVLLGVSMLSLRATKWWKFVAVVGAVLVVLATIGAWTTRFDNTIVSESGKSLGYRLQYWTSSTQMIRDRPLLGVGGGNFQDFYTQYKLPEASEEVRDPHNWLFEIAATAGLPALAVFCGVILLFICTMVFSRRPKLANETSNNINDWYIYSGGAAAFLIALVVGPFAGLPLGIEKAVCGVAIGGAVLFAMRDWVREGELSLWAVTIAVIVLLVNLLAAGGIMYPAVAGSMWLLMAIGLNLVSQPPIGPSKVPSIIVFVTCLLLVAAQYFTGYLPVIRFQGAMLEAFNQTNRITAQEQAILLATEFDPRASESWQELAALRQRRWIVDRRPFTLQEFRNAAEEFLLRRPQSSSAHRLVGKWWREIYDISPTEANAKMVARALARAVELYPNHAVTRAELAISLTNTKQPDAARHEAAKALELDAQTPHADKKISPTMRQEMTNILGASNDASR